VDVAGSYGEKLPADADSKALEDFLVKRRKADPLRFPDLSLVIVKLMGRGEYVADQPGESAIGHFGLAVKDYSHSTAPNRRFPDLITHRLLKAALFGNSPAYTFSELGALAAHCSEMEEMASKVERQVTKSAAALLLEKRIGQSFEGVITGASEKGTFVRIFDPPVEGMVVRHKAALKVGDKVTVSLVATNFERGFVDFACP
jgi:exoribonuclease-2